MKPGEKFPGLFFTEIRKTFGYSDFICSEEKNYRRAQCPGGRIGVESYSAGSRYLLRKVAISSSVILSLALRNSSMEPFSDSARSNRFSIS